MNRGYLQFVAAARNGYVAFLRHLPRTLALRIEYTRVNRRIPRLRHPERFSEKLLLRQLYDDNIDLINATGKLWGKQRAEDTEQLRVPTTYWRGTANAIRQDEHLPFLPPGRWVLKQNNLGGGIVYFGKGVQPYDSSIESFLEECAKASANFSHFGGPAWRRSPRGFFIEEFVGTSIPTDYKFHVFHNQVRVISIYEGRFDNLLVRHYSRAGKQFSVKSRYPSPVRAIPPNAMRMIPIAESLATGFDYLRVDLYELAGTVYFSEFSPFPALDGLGRSPAIDRYLGELWNTG